MADEGASQEYLTRLQEVEKSPPYLPFIGTFLKSLIDLFTIKDEGGTRMGRHRHNKQKEQEPDDHGGCSTAATRGQCYHSESDNDEDGCDDDNLKDPDVEQDDDDDEDDDFAKFFKKIDATSTNNKENTWVATPTHNVVMEKSPAYLMNETLFHYQIAALQYRWLDLPQVREFWMRIRLADEVEIWSTSCKREDIKRDREEKEVRMARKARVEEEFRKRKERMETRERLAKEAAKAKAVGSKASLFFSKTKSKMATQKRSIFKKH